MPTNVAAMPSPEPLGTYAMFMSLENGTSSRANPLVFDLPMPGGATRPHNMFSDAGAPTIGGMRQR